MAHVCQSLAPARSAITPKACMASLARRAYGIHAKHGMESRREPCMASIRGEYTTARNAVRSSQFHEASLRDMKHSLRSHEAALCAMKRSARELSPCGEATLHSRRLLHGLQSNPLHAPKVRFTKKSTRFRKCFFLSYLNNFEPCFHQFLLIVQAT